MKRVKFSIEVEMTDRQASDFNDDIIEGINEEDSKGRTGIFSKAKRASLIVEAAQTALDDLNADAIASSIEVIDERPAAPGATR